MTHARNLRIHAVGFAVVVWIIDVKLLGRIQTNGYAQVTAHLNVFTTLSGISGKEYSMRIDSLQLTIHGKSFREKIHNESDIEGAMKKLQKALQDIFGESVQVDLLVQVKK